MEEDKKCSKCKDSIMEKRISHSSAGASDGTLPKSENRVYYYCDECRGVFFEEDLAPDLSDRGEE